MSEQNKYLLLARQARKEDNSEDAAKYYDMVRTDDPENGEAKFFYAFFRMMSGTKGEAFTQFMNLCKCVSPAIELIDKSNETVEFKKSLCIDVVKYMQEAREIVITGFLDGRLDDIIKVYSTTMFSLGNSLLETYPGDVELAHLFLEIAHEIRSSTDYSPTTYKETINLCKEFIKVIAPKDKKGMFDIRKKYRSDSNLGNHSVIDEYNMKDDGPADLILPDSDEEDDYPIMAISEDAFKNSTSLVKLTIPFLFREIGRNAFEDCTNLRTIVFVEEEVERTVNIDMFAFSGCTNLTEIIIPENVTIVATPTSFCDCPPNIQDQIKAAAQKKDSKSSVKEFDGCAGVIKGCVDSILLKLGIKPKK